MDASVAEATMVAGHRHGWSDEHRWTVVTEYLRFLELARTHVGTALVPAADVDLVWHEHLASPAYAMACGGVGPRHDTHTTADRDERFAHTRHLYRARFGPPGAIWDTAADCQIDRPEPIAPPPPE